MLVMPFGIVILVRLRQPKNAKPPMLVTLSGIVMLVRLRQSLNALLPMLVTGNLLYVEGMMTFVSVHEPIPATE